MQRLLEDTAARATRYLDGLAEQECCARSEAVARIARAGPPLPDQPLAAESVLRELDEFVSPATTGMAGPRYFGFVIGGSLPAALAANWLAGAWDQNTGLYQATPGTSGLEQIALRWLLETARTCHRTCGAGFVTGTTVAHVTALAAARHAVLAQAGWNVEADGLFGAPPITVIVGEEAHTTLFKALGMVGLGRNRVVRVPVDGQGRMRADALPAISGPDDRLRPGRERQHRRL